MSKKSHTWRQRAVNAKTGREATHILIKAITIKDSRPVQRVDDIPSVLPLLTQRLAGREVVEERAA